MSRYTPSKIWWPGLVVLRLHHISPGRIPRVWPGFHLLHQIKTLNYAKSWAFFLMKIPKGVSLSLVPAPGCFGSKIVKSESVWRQRTICVTSRFTTLLAFRGSFCQSPNHRLKWSVCVWFLAENPLFSPFDFNLRIWCSLYRTEFGYCWRQL